MGILTQESGATMMSLLDEFLVHRSQQAVDTFAAALQDGDADAAQVPLAGEPSSDGFLHWITVLDTSGVEFFDCTYEPERVQCTTTNGPGFWYERIHRENVESTFSARVTAGKLDSVQWPAPLADRRANAEFEAWVALNHPELTNIMFDGTPMGKLTREAAETRVELLEEYLATL